MERMGYGPLRYCRWDGTRYKPAKDIGRDGFCCDACRNAHHRAFKKWRYGKQVRADLSLRAKRNAKKKVKRKKKLTRI
ncbi:hypothetical protein LCGC14_0898730 [marine sediment metagenome]|uniref:Uncharacterized protein n=1 Tax=marine sediment metagenome TaxID=412755 RepID=A0A0F9P1V6_9ZZZZ